MLHHGPGRGEFGHHRSVIPKIDRRAFLLSASAAPLALVAACASTNGAPDSDSADTRVRMEVAEAESALIAQYQATIGAFADLTPTLTAIMDQHRAHLAAMDVQPATPPPSVTIAGTAQQAVDALEDAERAATQQRRQACLNCVDPALARILALIAASEASHVPALGQVSG